MDSKDPKQLHQTDPPRAIVYMWGQIPDASSSAIFPESSRLPFIVVVIW